MIEVCIPHLSRTHRLQGAKHRANVLRHAPETRHLMPRCVPIWAAAGYLLNRLHRGEPFPDCTGIGRLFHQCGRLTWIYRIGAWNSDLLHGA